jgi:hypothetical protein
MRTILAIMLLGIGAAHAHDIYTDLVGRDGGSCCNGKDCKPAPYRMTAAGVEMFVDGRWVLVPEDVIQYRTLPGDTGETAGGHWYGLENYDATYCAILPPSAAFLVENEKKPTLATTFSANHEQRPARGIRPARR